LLTPQLSEARGANAQLRAQLEELKSDFKFNLQLLAERDAELERYDANTAQLEAETGAKAAMVLQLRSALAQAHSGG
jgi:chromosome segregation ATPase